jgi:hypothetical protein
MLLTSENPEKIAMFYKDLLGLDLKKEAHGGPVHWACESNGVHFAIHQADGFAKYSYPVTAHSNTTHLFFTVESMEETLGHLKHLNIEPVGPIENIGPMKMVTVMDPDQRAVMLGTPWS